MSLAIAFFVSTLLSTCCLKAVAWWAGTRVPIVDLLIIAGLCSGLALLPTVGWVLATVIMSLLVVRTTNIDPWPGAVLMIVGCNVLWFLVSMALLG
jgi:hypothetical protein